MDSKNKETATAIEERPAKPSAAEQTGSRSLCKAVKRIWFFGHFGLGNGCGNFGNESTFKAALCNLRRILPGVEINCICTAPEIIAGTYQITALPISRLMADVWSPATRLGRTLRSVLIGIPCEIFRWFSGLRLLRRGDILLIPGTGLISDAYGLRGWGPYSVFKWSAIAKLRGCKLLFVSVGVGPVYSRLGKFLVKSALALADFRSYRDRASLEYVRTIGFRAANDRVYPDLAFSLPHDVIALDTHKSRRTPIAGLGVMLYAGKYSIESPDANTPRKYLENLALLVTWLLGRGYDVRLLVGDFCDRPTVREFKRLLEEKLPPSAIGRILDEEPATVEQLLSQIAETDLIVATRFHNVLLSALMNKPVVAIAFHHKVSSLMESMGLQDYCQDIHHMDAEKLIEQFRQLEENAPTLRRTIAEMVARNREALEEQYRLIFSDLLLGGKSVSRKVSAVPAETAGSKTS